MDTDNLGLQIEDFFEYEKWEIIKYEDKMRVALSDIAVDVLFDLNAQEYMYVIDGIISEIDVSSIIDEYLEKLCHEDARFEEYKEQSYFSNENQESKGERIDVLFKQT